MAGIQRMESTESNVGGREIGEESRQRHDMALISKASSSYHDSALVDYVQKSKHRVP